MADLHKISMGFTPTDFHSRRPEEQRMPNTRVLLVKMQNGTCPTMCPILIEVPKRPPLPVGEDIVLTS